MNRSKRGAAALVVPAFAPNAYGTIRSLAARGVPVWALDHRPGPLRRSRLCRLDVVPDPGRDPRAFVEHIRALAASFDVPPVLFAAQDLHALVIQEASERLRDHVRFPFMEAERFLPCVDKRLMLARAAALGLTVPETHTPASVDELERLLPVLRRYPYVLKPAAKFERRQGIPARNLAFYATYRTKALRARTPDALRRRFAEVRAAGFTVLVQEEIEGPAGRLAAVDLYADAGGRVLATHTGRKIRQMPADFGTCTLGCSSPVEAILPAARALVEGLGFRGLGNVEFKERGGRWYLMELNPRPWMWIQLATASGVNLPYLAWRDLQGLPVTNPVADGRARRWVDLRVDCEHLVRGGDGRPRLGVGSWLRSLLAVRVEARGTLADPGPVWDAVSTAVVRRLRRSLSIPARAGAGRRAARPEPNPCREVEPWVSG